MGIPLMIQTKDNQKIEHLKIDLGFEKKIDVIRAGLALLEAQAARTKRIKRWQHAAKLVAKSSTAVHKKFQPHLKSKLKSI